MTVPAFVPYWGKARQENAGAEIPAFHLLACHCLDVSFVAHLWWEASSHLRSLFLQNLGGRLEEGQAKAWLLFFLALHDIGKWDIRFQLKAGEAFAAIRPDWDSDLCAESRQSVKSYDHGKMGFEGFFHDVNSIISDSDNWYRWMSVMTGHHGSLPAWIDAYHPPDADETVIESDGIAKRAWLQAVESHFLVPAGLSLSNDPPEISDAGCLLAAGLCSVVDWIGSQPALFPYVSDWDSSQAYWSQIGSRLDGRNLLADCGLVRQVAAYGGVEAILSARQTPRQIQTIIPELPIAAGLTIIEAPTGCGKTEAGIAYAWKLLATGQADSIVFALPTQATANAMFERMLTIAAVLFGESGGNVVLAHGKRMHHHAFRDLCRLSSDTSPQGSEDGRIQCSQWLASSKKRIFLGQIGICTIDQVLLSVLPVRHNFVRTFGLGRSVLLVDEVHAYDAYMYSLLEEVLSRQAAAGGSAVLLSATLPAPSKMRLIQAWTSKRLPAEESYPLVTYAAVDGGIQTYTLPSSQLPPDKEVGVTVTALHETGVLSDLFERVSRAVQAGVLVAMIFNTVDSAQRAALELKRMGNLCVDVFHSRYMFADRQAREDDVIRNYGLHASRERGRVLVATQVVEQSLDLDVDWLITELCPADLLFQRIGRLHRHNRSFRPSGYETPRVEVLLPAEEDYGSTGLIYGDRRLLHRTARLLHNTGGSILFPCAYRQWVEHVYQEEAWADEPPAVTMAHETYADEQEARRFKALNLIRQTTVPLADDDGRVAALTRDGEMQLKVLLLNQDGGLLADGNKPDLIPPAVQADAVDRSCVPVPASWRGVLPAADSVTGLISLTMQEITDNRWEAVNTRQTIITYDIYLGLRRERS